MAIIKSKYNVNNGTSWDTHYYETSADMVMLPDGTNAYDHIKKADISMKNFKYPYDIKYLNGRLIKEGTKITLQSLTIKYHIDECNGLVTGKVLTKLDEEYRPKERITLPCVIGRAGVYKNSIENLNIEPNGEIIVSLQNVDTAFYSVYSANVTYYI